ncbi:hypothetical protein SAMN00790413_00266 [Deinococcus hopiensis KR-140]|uniref:Uncharacterized protein n=1 Tax=Deinococcus hopiensis KR-140 TaxID=695939 RepID=A0A1W1V7B4_9DEIO|nr:hypothetical protein SAMN00790413_00266 [Deinococcus hopiensis KR-140]
MKVTRYSGCGVKLEVDGKTLRAGRGRWTGMANRVAGCAPRSTSKSGRWKMAVRCG